MTDNVFDDIATGLREAIDFVKGTGEGRVHVPQEIDVKAIRTELDMSQETFAAQFGFPIGTLRNWEQGLRKPDGPSRAYLMVIKHDPLAVISALTKSEDDEAPQAA